MDALERDYVDGYGRGEGIFFIFAVNYMFYNNSVTV